ncbi:DNA-binding transcription factor [Lithospermum erythrorhizon]|uniref:DNA-binding transcription factor n=1 Tax=Lithospermum erythrorhizon TaxID=34254 RepID=A0AAV3PCQ1_LITER
MRRRMANPISEFGNIVGEGSIGNNIANHESNATNINNNENTIAVEELENDQLMPLANIDRIMRQILPYRTKVSKEAKLTIQKCVSEFISFITSEAKDNCTLEQRRKINGDDLIIAMRNLGFIEYANILSIYLIRLRQDANEPLPPPQPSQGHVDGSCNYSNAIPNEDKQSWEIPDLSSLSNASPYYYNLPY